MDFLTKPASYRERNPLPAATLTSNDIEGIHPRTKQLDVVLHAEAQALSLEAMSKQDEEVMFETRNYQMIAMHFTRNYHMVGMHCTIKH